MAEDNGGTSSSLAFIVGGLVVAVGVLVYVLYGQGLGQKDVTIKIDVPKLVVPAPAPKP